MKEMYLIYGSAVGGYFFSPDNQYDSPKREPWGKLEIDGLAIKLKSSMDGNDPLIDPKRKTLLHLVDIPDGNRERIKQVFKGTKIELIFESHSDKHSA